MSRPTALLVIAVATLSGPPAGAEPPAPAPDSDGLVFGAPVAYHNMTLVPVTTRAKGPFVRYDLLETGLAARTLSIRELAGRSDEASVNAVEIRNRGQRPVFLLGGEMILGGKQDRIIQSDTVVGNNGKWHRVAVFCVEQGRWRGRKMAFSAGNALAHGGLQAAALTGSQSKVWEEVSRKNMAHGTENSTQTYRRTIQNEDVRRQIANYRGELRKLLPKDGTLAGFVFGINGQIRVADLFGNPPLLADLQDKLLSAYILEALEHEVAPDAQPVQKDAAEQFFDTARKAPRQAPKRSGRAKVWKKRGKGFVGSETLDEATGSPVRESYHAQ